jgi:hypothetical protein
LEECPKCQSRKVHRSRTRSVVERFRRNFTGKAPFRCDGCGWRGWGLDFGGHGDGCVGRPPEGPEPDLEAIDRELSREAGK